MINLIKEIENGLDNIGVKYILCESDGRLKVCFTVEKIDEDIIRKIYYTSPYIITKTFDGRFLFHEDVQIYINSNSQAEQIDCILNNQHLNRIKQHSSLKKEKFEDHDVFSLHNLQYNNLFSFKIFTGKKQHYLRASFQSNFIGDDVIWRYRIKNEKISLEHGNKKVSKKEGRKYYEATGVNIDVVFSTNEHPLLDLKISKDYEENERAVIEYVNTETAKATNIGDFLELKEFKDNIYNSAMCIYFRSFLHYYKVKKELWEYIDLLFKQELFKPFKDDFLKYLDNENLFNNFLRSNREKYILRAMESIKNSFIDYSIYLVKNDNFNILSDNVIFFITKDGLTNLLEEQDIIYAIVMVYNKDNFIVLKSNDLDIANEEINKKLLQINDFILENCNDFFVLNKSLNDYELKDIVIRRKNAVYKNILKEDTLLFMKDFIEESINNLKNDYYFGMKIKSCVIKKNMNPINEFILNSFFMNKKQIKFDFRLKPSKEVDEIRKMREEARCIENGRLLLIKRINDNVKYEKTKNENIKKYLKFELYKNRESIILLNDILVKIGLSNDGEYYFKI